MRRVVSHGFAEARDGETARDCQHAIVTIRYFQFKTYYLIKFVFPRNVNAERALLFKG